MLVRVHEKPPCGKHAHQRGLAVLASHEHNHLAEAIRAILKQFERVHEQPLLPRVKVDMQHDLRERDHRETIARLLGQRPERRSEDARQCHAMPLIVDGTENRKILRRHRNLLSRNAS